MCYHHVIDDDSNETIMTTTDPMKAASRAMQEAMAGRNVRYEAPATLEFSGVFYYPGQLISVEETSK